MTLGHEDKDNGTKLHPYWYAKVLGIFHVNVRHLGRMETERMDFLWVHWFGRNLDHEGGFATCRLHHIRLTDSKDFTSYRFLNPSDVLRAVHLIPAFKFSPNQTIQNANVSDSSGNSDDAHIQEFQYVSMYKIPSFHLLRHSQIPRFIDRDMFMHFVGRAIGHK